MTEQQVPFEKPLSPPDPPTIIDDLFDLTTAGSLDTMVGKALRMVIKALDAEAGSILFYANSLKTSQAGAFRQDALVKIRHWENNIGRRLIESSWHISKSTQTVSASSLANSRQVLVSTPLLQNTKVVGLLSLVLPPDTKLAMSRRILLGKLGSGLGHILSVQTNLELSHRRLNQISIFHEVSQALIATFDVNKLLLNAMSLTTKLVDAGAASILLVDKDENQLVFKVSHGARSEMLRQQRIPITEGIAGWVVRNARPVIANDARADNRFSHRVDVRTGFLTQSIAAVPLKTKNGVVGVLEVLNKYSDRGFAQSDIQLMSFIASQAAIALENAHEYNRLVEERDLIIKTQQAAYQEIIDNIHDGTLQYLAAIGLSLDHLNILSRKAGPDVLQNQITAMRHLVDQATRNTRNLLFELRPPVLKTHGLITACHHLVDQLRAVGTYDVHFNTVDRVNFSPKFNASIFSVIQEAINNVLRHANANNIWILLNVDDEQFVATIRDDGQGFNTEIFDDADDQQSSLGILNIKEQAAAINAELKIESRTHPPHRGTTIQLSLPSPATETEN